MKKQIIKKPNLKPEPAAASEEKPENIKAKKTYTPRFYMMILSGAVSLLGLALFVIYFFTTNVIIGAPGVVMAVVGIFAFRYYWKQEGNISVEHIGGKKKAEAFNSLVIRRDKINFENMAKPEGFPQVCLNDGKKYFVYIQDARTEAIAPFTLPDQQYYDPIVFAQRVLGLPAHKKIFERKPKLLQKLKTALLVLAIGIVWLLIMTTTGGG